METTLQLVLDGIGGGLVSILRISLILIPVMVVMEIARACNILERVSAKIKGALRFLTLPGEAAFPLVVGLGFGVVYGAALIISYAREGILNKRDLLLTGVFLSISHAVVEDTLIFTVFGANPFIIFGLRFLLAVLITRLAAAIIDFSRGDRLPHKISADGDGPPAGNTRLP